jgi:hypothetical protein
MNTEAAKKAIEEIPKERVAEYAEYWESITPDNHSEIVKRWLFAFMSVHTSWRRNVLGYKAVAKDLSWWFKEDKESLLQKISTSGVGLQNQRLKGIWKLLRYCKYNNINILDRNFYEHLSWQEYRDTLVQLFKGAHIGMAKVSFAIEMMYPKDCQVVCLDTHMLRLYGHSGKTAFKPGDTLYRAMEDHWVETCNNLGYSPTMARHAYWDTLQSQPNTKYWSYVFDKKDLANDKF